MFTVCAVSVAMGMGTHRGVEARGPREDAAAVVGAGQQRARAADLRRLHICRDL
jgi:hypothetical protein